MESEIKHSQVKHSIEEKYFPRSNYDSCVFCVADLQSRFLRCGRRNSNTECVAKENVIQFLLMTETEIGSGG